MPALEASPSLHFGQDAGRFLHQGRGRVPENSDGRRTALDQFVFQGNRLFQSAYNRLQGRHGPVFVNLPGFVPIFGGQGFLD